MLSFPRRRESSLISMFWIPAFAGMTEKCNVIYCVCISTTPTNSVYGAMQDGYVKRFDQKISPHPSPLP